ncbi:MAG: bifunctional pyr operon transcriptional regulator/uracil phosphoribosyltransferase PyrR [Balneolaceae bacterium]
MPEQIVLMNKDRIARTLKRLAIQVWERLQPDQELVLIGLNERGFATAKGIHSQLVKMMGAEIEIHKLDVLNTGPKKTLPSCTEKFVLMIDDVIFSGKTMFGALATLCYSNEPQNIEVLTLVDRGHRTYPVLSELTGIVVPTKFGEHIEVILNDEELHQVVLFKNM